jgi:hypothetical protein
LTEKTIHSELELTLLKRSFKIIIYTTVWDTREYLQVVAVVYLLKFILLLRINGYILDTKTEGENTK